MKKSLVLFLVLQLFVHHAGTIFHKFPSDSLCLSFFYFLLDHIWSMCITQNVGFFLEKIRQTVPVQSADRGSFRGDLRCTNQHFPNAYAHKHVKCTSGAPLIEIKCTKTYQNLPKVLIFSVILANLSLLKIYQLQHGKFLF